MSELTPSADPTGEVVELALSGYPLLHCPMFNKGSAFTEEERCEFGLQGLLPPHVSSLDVQVARVSEEYQQKPTDLERHIFLRALQDLNEVLFYALMTRHIAAMMPIIYTPTVGAACQQYSHIFRRPRGLFIAYPERDAIDAILANAPYPNVEVIVVTDGERILGLGDQGTGGMGIPIGKLSLYTLCGGIHPAATLPVLLDAGTDNPGLLADPLYMGWRHPRVRGPEYDEFIEAFVTAVQRRFPRVLLQWEDFAQANAGRLLARYRERLCTFNDDIQGSAAVTTGALLAAVRVTGGRLRDQRVVIVGAGSAGVGIAEQVSRAMTEEGLSAAEARGRLWLLDRAGLLCDDTQGLAPFQRTFARPRTGLADWQLGEGVQAGLLDVVRNVRPTVLIGASGQPGLFTEDAVREMARHTSRPVIFPLSNPPSRCEAHPADLLAWTAGQALIATGSPYPDVDVQGRRVRVAQCNNSYVFPGVGLGVLAAGATRVTDAMFMAAARALAECSPAGRGPDAPLLPPLEEIRAVSRHIALAVAAAARRDGVAAETTAEQASALIDARMWVPHYPRLRRKPDAASRPA